MVSVKSIVAFSKAKPGNDIVMAADGDLLLRADSAFNEALAYLANCSVAQQEVAPDK